MSKGSPETKSPLAYEDGRELGTDKDSINNGDIISSIKKLAIFYMNNIATYKGTRRIDLATTIASNSNITTISKSGDGGDVLWYDAKTIFTNLPKLQLSSFMINDVLASGVAYKGKNFDLNQKPLMTADFCADFALSVIRFNSDGDRGEDPELWEYDKVAERKRDVPIYGLNLHQTNASTMYGATVDANEKVHDTPGCECSWNFENAMTNLGYKKIRVTENMTVGDLQEGDLLISKKHAEFYVGTMYSSEYFDENGRTEDARKKSGTKEIYDLSGPHKQLKDGDKAEGTFGWGNVHDEFSVEDKNGKHYTYFFKNNNEAYFRLCQCGLESPDGSHAGNCDYNNTMCQYEIIWRKQ